MIHRAQIRARLTDPEFALTMVGGIAGEFNSNEVDLVIVEAGGITSALTVEPEVNILLTLCGPEPAELTNDSKSRPWLALLSLLASIFA